ncbi:hypothetical protein AcV5_003780 [Taiwanofungus camphoratus]|nr:hypothetical protein AcV5_003780 [Antrodia cinnamomea]
MSLLSLNYDVLALILALVSPRDASQLACTCRRAYEVAMPRFLSDVTLGGVFHKSDTSAALQLSKFCKFMLAGVPERLFSLQRLEVRRDAVRRRVCGSWIVDASCVALLTEVMSKAIYLQKITVWGFDALFTAYPPIVDALASLPFLRSVCLGGDIPSIPTLARAFPNISSLQLVDGGGSCGPDWDMQSTTSSWPSLDHVDTGHPILPLACPVRRVDLRNPLYPDEFVLLNALQFIQCTQPAVLSLVVDASLIDADFCSRLKDVNPDLRFLSIVLHGSASVSAVTSWMTRVAHALTSLPLLGLTFCGAGSSVPAHDHPDAKVPALSIVARAVAEAVPSLQYVGLQPLRQSTHSTCDLEWFRAVPRFGGKARQVEALSFTEGASTQRMLQALDIYD